MTDRIAIVTGGSGFIGRHTLPYLLKRGFNVHVISSTPTPSLQELLNIYGVAAHNMRFHRLDLHDSDSIAPFIRDLGASHLLHLAWETTHGEFWSSPKNIDWIVTSKIVLQAFIEGGGRRVVAAGTCAEYDWSGDDYLLQENSSKLTPHSLFGQTKLAFRKSLFTISEHHAVSAAWGRVFFLFGPHEDRRRLVASAITSLLKGDRVHASAGNHERDFLFVEDVAHAFVALLDSSVTGDVNIASGEPTCVAEILTTLGEIVGRRELIHLGAKLAGAQEPRRLVASVNRLREEVGVQHARSLRDALEQSVRWWRGLDS